MAVLSELDDSTRVLPNAGGLESAATAEVVTMLHELAMAGLGLGSPRRSARN